jgi:hypothetical protein
MRRIVCLLAGVLLVALGSGSDAPKEYDGSIDADDIQGAWELTSHGYRGDEHDPGIRCVWTRALKVLMGDLFPLR